MATQIKDHEHVCYLCGETWESAAHASEIRRAVDDQGRPIGHTAARASEPIDLEAGGKLVRDTWIAWAKEQPNVKSSWLVPWEELSEPDKEVDRRIYAACRAARATEPWTPQMLSRLFDAECSPEQAIERICYLHNATLQPARASESEPWKPISQGGKADEPHDIRIDGQHCVEVGRGLRIVLAICDAHNATLQPAQVSEQKAAIEKAIDEANHFATLEESQIESRAAQVSEPSEMLDAAWGIIANAGGGDWTRESKDWQEASAKWRDEYHKNLSARTQPCQRSSQNDNEHCRLHHP